MIRDIARGLAPVVAITLAASLSGCFYVNDWDEVEGVPLSELDTSGDAPTRISLAGPDKVEISEGDGLTITLAGDDGAAAALRFDRDGDKLMIARDRSVFDGYGQTAIVQISMPAPTRLSVSGSGNISSAVMASEARIDVAGSGKINVATIDAEDLRVDIAGSGTATGAGSAESLQVDIAGSGDVELGDLMADDVNVSIAGSGDVNLASNGTVNANIAGSGDVTVTGSAKCSMRQAGSGSLTCRPGSDAAEEDGESDEASES